MNVQSKTHIVITAELKCHLISSGLGFSPRLVFYLVERPVVRKLTKVINRVTNLVDIKTMRTKRGVLLMYALNPSICTVVV